MAPVQHPLLQHNSFPFWPTDGNGSLLLLILGCCAIPYCFPETLTFIKLFSIASFESASSSLDLPLSSHLVYTFPRGTDNLKEDS